MRALRQIFVLGVLVLSGFLAAPRCWGYAGGSGTGPDPFQLAEANDLAHLGATPTDCNKCFVLVNDIDLSGRTWSGAVIPLFSGRLDGRGFSIRNLAISGKENLGLIGALVNRARIQDLGVKDANVVGTGDDVGILAGVLCSGTVIRSYSTGKVRGNARVGGLVGREWDIASNNYPWIPDICRCSAPNPGRESGIINCYSTAEVCGDTMAGGLVGAAGLLNANYPNPHVLGSYSTGRVYAKDSGGGLVGVMLKGLVTDSFWDIETSGQTQSAGGRGLSTIAMQDPNTYLGAGWDLAGETGNGLHETWQMPPGGGYPVLGFNPAALAGEGTEGSPYLVSSAMELGAVMYHDLFGHYRLTGDIDLAGTTWRTAVIPEFSGVFDGNGFTVHNLTVFGQGWTSLGLFGQLGYGARVERLGIADANIEGTWREAGSLAGQNLGVISHCSASFDVNGIGDFGGLVGDNWHIVEDSQAVGRVHGSWFVGGLVGFNSGVVIRSHTGGFVSGANWVGGLLGENDGLVEGCYSTATVEGTDKVGGLVGGPQWRSPGSGRVVKCHFDGLVKGVESVGGLVGDNRACSIADSYSLGAVTGKDSVGGLVGRNDSGSISNSYSASVVRGDSYVGGLVGGRVWSTVNHCLWDVETSGVSKSAGGVGLATERMQDIQTFLNAGWDFVGETANGTVDLWRMPEGGYPRLAWERQIGIETGGQASLGN